MSLEEEWKNLLLDTRLARAYSFIYGDPPNVDNPLLDSILSSSLLIRAVSLLDDGLINYIDSNSIKINSKNPKLYNRLQELNNLGKLPNYKELDKWRGRRNDIGHKTSGLYTWIELDECLNEVFKALKRLGILSEHPQFNVYKTTARISPSEPNIEIEQSVTVKVTEKDHENHVFRSFEWRIQVNKNGSVRAVPWNNSSTP